LKFSSDTGVHAWISRTARRNLVLSSVGLWGCLGERPPPALPAFEGAVSSSTPEATEAGLAILARGGNAVDAAIAISLVLGVTEPSQSGLGGDVAVLLAPAAGDPILIHAPVWARPDEAAEGMVARPPSALRLLHHTWTRFGSGRLTWQDLVEPAIHAASEGHTLGRFSHRMIVMEYDRILLNHEAMRLVLAPDRSIPSQASRVANPDLAFTLQAIADGGVEVFYGGRIGAQMARDLSVEGVTLTEASLSAPFQPVEVRALRGSYRGRTVWVAPAPYGGPFIVEALRFLDQAPPRAIQSPGWSRTAWFVEAFAYAWSGGETSPIAYLESLPPMPVAPVVDTLADVANGRGTRGASLRATGNGSSRPVTAGGSATQPPAGHDQTSHFSVVDGAGNAVSVTQTLGAAYGSGIVPEGLGFFYQDLGPREPGDAPLGPTIVVNEGRVELVLGSPGGERGLAAVVQVLVRRLGLREPLSAAVAAPRLFLTPPSEDVRGRLFIEGVAWDDAHSIYTRADQPWGAHVADHSRERGFTVGAHATGPVRSTSDPWFGAVNVVAWMDGGWSAVGDERRDGVGGVLRAGAIELQSGSRGAAAPSREPTQSVQNPGNGSR